MTGIPTLPATMIYVDQALAAKVATATGGAGVSAAVVTTEATTARAAEAANALAIAQEAALARVNESAEATTARAAEASKAAATALTSEATTARAAESSEATTARAAESSEATTARAAEGTKAPLANAVMTNPTLNGKVIVGGSILHPVTVNNRAPTANDGTSTNYGVGSYWNGPNGAYVSLRATAGAAAWVANDGAASMLPLDILPGAIAAYGTRKLKASYTGSAIQVTRTSDSTTLNVGFIGNVLDTASLDAFCVNTTYAITTWYDQSGNNNHATAAVATAPHMAAYNKIGNSRAVLFDNQWTGSGNSPACFMTLPAGVAATFSASSGIVLARTRDTQHATHLVQWTNASNSIIIGRSSGNFQSAATIQGIGSFATGAYMTATPYVTGYLSSASQFERFQDDILQGGGGTGNNATLAGGFLGEAPAMDSYSGYQEMAAVILYNAGITDTQRQNLTASLHWNFGTIPQARSNLVVDGDSITDGYQCSFMQNWLRLAEPMFQKPMRITNLALYGDTLSGRVGAYSGAVAPAFAAGAADNIAIIFAGTNDFGANATAAAVQASIQSYASAARATGFKLVVATVLPVSSRTTAQETARVAYNTWLVANWSSFADALADVNGDPTIGGAATVAANTALYADGLHPTTLGYSYIAPIFAAAVNSLLST